MLAGCNSVHAYVVLQLSKGYAISTDNPVVFDSFCFIARRLVLSEDFNSHNLVVIDAHAERQCTDLIVLVLKAVLCLSFAASSLFLVRGLVDTA